MVYNKKGFGHSFAARYYRGKVWVNTYKYKGEGGSSFKSCILGETIPYPIQINTRFAIILPNFEKGQLLQTIQHFQFVPFVRIFC